MMRLWMEFRRRHKKKCSLCIRWECRGVTYKEYLKTRQTIDSDTYCKLLNNVNETGKKQPQSQAMTMSDYYLFSHNICTSKAQFLIQQKSFLRSMHFLSRYHHSSGRQDLTNCIGRMRNYPLSGFQPILLAVNTYTSTAVPVDRYTQYECL